MAIYEFTTRIRYSEVDANGLLTNMGLVDLFQNCSTFQSEDLHYGVEYLRQNERVWVLSSWLLNIIDMPHLGDTVIVQTWSHGIRHALGSRNFALRTLDGKLLACADSLWAYLSTVTGKPCTPPEDMIAAYGCDTALEMPSYSRKIALFDNMNEHPAFTVPYYYLDTNNHMNNGKYILAAMEYIPEGFVTKNIRAEYKASAMLHDTIIPYVHISDEDITVSLNAPDGSIYAIVQFIA